MPCDYFILCSFLLLDGVAMRCECLMYGAKSVKWIMSVCTCIIIRCICIIGNERIFARLILVYFIGCNSVKHVGIPITENRVFVKKRRTLGTIRMCAYCI